MVEARKDETEVSLAAWVGDRGDGCDVNRGRGDMNTSSPEPSRTATGQTVGPAAVKYPGVPLSPSTLARAEPVWELSNVVPWPPTRLVQPENIFEPAPAQAAFASV